MSYQMRQSYNIQIATKKPMALVHVQYLGKVRRPPLQSDLGGPGQDMRIDN